MGGACTVLNYAYNWPAIDPLLIGYEVPRPILLIRDFPLLLLSSYHELLLPTGLLAEYLEELSLTRSVQRRVEDLTQEMETLIDTFTTTARELEEQCYRTP